MFWFSVVSGSVNLASFQTLVLTGRLFEPLTYKIFKDVQLKKVFIGRRPVLLCYRHVSVPPDSNVT